MHNKRKRDSSKRRPSKMRKTGRLAACERQIKDVKKQIDSINSTFIFREAVYGELLSQINATTSAELQAGSVGDFNSSLNVAKIYDPVTGQLVDTDLSVGGTNKEVRCTGWHQELTLRANYIVDAHYTIYSCTVKIDTDKPPLTMWLTGLGDMTNAGISSNLMYPSDVRELNEVWNVKKVKQGVLASGQEIRVSHYHNKPFMFSHSLNQEIDATFLKRYGTQFFIIRLSGPVGHDSIAPDLGGYVQTGVDLMVKRTIKWEYDGGANFTFIRVSNGTSLSFPNSDEATPFRLKGYQAFTRS